MKEKLKTLKDFDKSLDHCQVDWHYHVYDEYTLIRWIDLREEAKKWIDKIETKIKEKEGQFDDFGIDLGMAYAETGGAIIGFIKHFFNLEDEK